MTSSTTIGIVGSSLTLSCSSDLDPVRIEWYRNNTLLSQSDATSDSITLGVISIDDEGAVYTCSAVGRHGSQERNKTLQVKGTKSRLLLCYVILRSLHYYAILVPDNWAAIEINNLNEGGALHEHNYSLVCTVQTIPGMNITPQIYWYYGPDGTIIKTGGRFIVDAVNKNGSITTVSLTFSHALHDDGGVYSCRAQVTVPWMTTQPPVKQATINIAVTSKALKVHHDYHN